MDSLSIGFFSFLLLHIAGIAQGDIMVAALHDTGCGNHRQLGLFLQGRNGNHAAVAHGRFHLVQALLHVLMQAAGVGDIGVHAFLELQAGLAAHIVTLPVPGAVGAFAPSTL